MQTHPVYLGFAVLFVAAAAGALALGRRGEPLRRAGVVAATLPAAVFLGLFASLAFHLHGHFQGWPGLGTDGFPPALALHSDLAYGAFGTLFLGTLTAWPLAVLVCALVPRLRPGLRYLGLFALATGLAVAATMLAPGGFLSWWWD
jgi:hypothetical protein